MSKPCAQCPWRISNHGKPHPGGFYTRRNIKRLWNQIRSGGRPQGCHLTDPSHPDHIAAGCAPNAKAQECPGSVILIKRELLTLTNSVGLVKQDDAHVVDDAKLVAYLRDTSKRRLTRHGMIYWLVKRASAFAGTPFGDRPLPDCDENDPEIGLPEYIQ